MGMGGKRLAPAILPLGKGLITLLQEAVWAPVSLCGPQCHCVGPSVTVDGCGKSPPVTSRYND